MPSFLTSENVNACCKCLEKIDRGATPTVVNEEC